MECVGNSRKKKDSRKCPSVKVVGGGEGGGMTKRKDEAKKRRREKKVVIVIGNQVVIAPPRRTRYDPINGTTGSERIFFSGKIS